MSVNIPELSVAVPQLSVAIPEMCVAINPNGRLCGNCNLGRRSGLEQEHVSVQEPVSTAGGGSLNSGYDSWTEETVGYCRTLGLYDNVGYCSTL